MDKNIGQIFDKIVEHGKQDAAPAFQTTDSQKAGKSYFEEPRHKDQLYFQVLDLSSGEGLSKELNQLWKEDPFMLSLVEPMVGVATELRKTGESQSAELGTFIYMMY